MPAHDTAFIPLSNPSELMARGTRRIWKMAEWPMLRPNAGARRKAVQVASRTDTGLSYLTPKTGRPGWNVRASFPADNLKSEIPFVVCDTVSAAIIIFTMYSPTLGKCV